MFGFGNGGGNNSPVSKPNSGYCPPGSLNKKPLDEQISTVQVQKDAAAYLRSMGKVLAEARTAAQAIQERGGKYELDLDFISSGIESTFGERQKNSDVGCRVGEDRERPSYASMAAHPTNFDKKKLGGDTYEVVVTYTFRGSLTDFEKDPSRLVCEAGNELLEKIEHGTYLWSAKVTGGSSIFPFEVGFKLDGMQATDLVGSKHRKSAASVHSILCNVGSFQAFPVPQHIFRLSTTVGVSEVQAKFGAYTEADIRGSVFSPNVEQLRELNPSAVLEPGEMLELRKSLDGIKRSDFSFINLNSPLAAYIKYLSGKGRTPDLMPVDKLLPGHAIIESKSACFCIEQLLNILEENPLRKMDKTCARACRIDGKPWTCLPENMEPNEAFHYLNHSQTLVWQVTYEIQGLKIGGAWEGAK